MNKMKSPFAFSTEIEADLSNFDLYEDIHVTSGLNGCSHLQFKRLPEQLAFDGWEWTRQEEISFNKKHPFNFLCIRTFFFYYDARLLMCS